MFLNAHRPFQTVNSKNFAFERHRRIVLPTADQLAMAKKRNVTRKSSETNKGSPNYGTAKMPLYQQLIRYYLPYCEIFVTRNVTRISLFLRVFICEIK